MFASSSHRGVCHHSRLNIADLPFLMSMTPGFGSWLCRLRPVSLSPLCVECWASEAAIPRSLTLWLMRDAHGDDDDLYNLSAPGLGPDYKTDEYASAVCFQCQWVTEKKSLKDTRNLITLVLFRFHYETSAHSSVPPVIHFSKVTQLCLDTWNSL